MIKSLMTFDNEKGLLFDKALLKQLNITDDTKLKIVVHDNVVIIVPIDVSDEQAAQEGYYKNKKFEETVKKIMEKYAPALKKLAEN